MLALARCTARSYVSKVRTIRGPHTHNSSNFVEHYAMTASFVDIFLAEELLNFFVIMHIEWVDQNVQTKQHASLTKGKGLSSPRSTVSQCAKRRKKRLMI